MKLQLCTPEGVDAGCGDDRVPGTLGLDAVRGRGGSLKRTFDSCLPGKASLASMDGILSLQHDRPELVAQHTRPLAA